MWTVPLKRTQTSPFFIPGPSCSLVSVDPSERASEFEHSGSRRNRHAEVHGGSIHNFQDPEVTERLFFVWRMDTRSADGPGDDGDADLLSDRRWKEMRATGSQP